MNLRKQRLYLSVKRLRFRRRERQEFVSETCVSSGNSCVVEKELLRESTFASKPDLLESRFVRERSSLVHWQECVHLKRDVHLDPFVLDGADSLIRFLR